MERRTTTLALLCVVWSAAAAIQVDIPNPEYEMARGDNVTLPCTFKSILPNPKLVIITWSAGDAVVLTYYHPTGELDIQLEGRASLDVNINGGSGKADLTLYSVTSADNNKYKCHVQIPKDDKGKDADTATLTVLVAPSKPVCKIQGTASYGQNINLTCVSEEGSPPPTYKWNSYDVLNNPRAQDPRTTDKGGILSLYNITKDTSGFYICISQNKIRSASCNLTLSVLPPSMNIGSTAAIIGVAIAALILLIIIIYCCCCRKKKDDKENYAMAPVGDEESDRNGEGRKGNEEKSRNYDDSSVIKAVTPRDNYEERSERNYDRRTDSDDRRTDYDDRRSDYDDRRSDYNDRRKDYDDRRSDYDDRRSDYNDRRSDYNDRRSDYDDRRSDYDDRRSKPSDRNERYDDERRYNDRRDPRYDDDRNRP